MVETWAISGVDLHLDLTGTRVRAALESALRDAIRSGRLSPGTRLPSSRSLAGDLGIARNTAADAYGQLVAEGWLTARQGSGTTVAARPAATTGEAPATAPPAHARYDLRAGMPNLTAFPRAAWLAAARKALSAAPADTLGYGDPRGLPQLRTALAGYLARARGVHVDPDRILVCSGFLQGLRLLCEVLRARGASTIAMESCGHQTHRDAVRAGGLDIAPLPVDNDGARVDLLGTAAAAMLTPAHQFPIGVPLAPDRRMQAVAWAHDTAGLIIEDDYDGEFRYDRSPVGALQALTPEHVVYAGTASKTLAPGIRLAWLVLPAGLVAEVAEAKRLTDGQSPTLDQLTLAELINSGGYDRHIRRCRLAYRRRRDRLVAALRTVPSARITGIAAGMHAVLELPDAATEAAVVTRAAEHGLIVEGLSTYRMTPDPGAPALVIGYTTPPDHAYTNALARLTATLTDKSLAAQGFPTDGQQR
jgi:GntR family transcriptional regulator / MocR family aminotransferase